MSLTKQQKQQIGELTAQLVSLTGNRDIDPQHIVMAYGMAAKSMVQIIDPKHAMTDDLRAGLINWFTHGLDQNIVTRPGDVEGAVFGGMMSSAPGSDNPQ
jgi:hypothetical protein